jgi:dihydrofolate reductase
MQTYVFSRTMNQNPAPGVELVTTEAGAFVNKLKRRKGRGICVMGGGELARSLFQAGVIDEVGLNIHPILLGAGVALFPEIGRRVNLELLDSRILDGGCVLANYRVRR